MAWSENVFPEDQEPLQKFIDALDLEWLRNHANSVHGTHECSTRTDVFSAGRENIAFELSFPGSLWIARIALPSFVPLIPPFVHRGPAEIKSEITTIEFVSKNTSIPVPRIFDYNVEASNPLQ